MVALQGFIDDSGEQDDPSGPVIVLAGFIATAERWAAFSDNRQAALDAKPPIAYFKMVEAARLRGEFRRGVPVPVGLGIGCTPRTP